MPVPRQRQGMDTRAKYLKLWRGKVSPCNTNVEALTPCAKFLDMRHLALWVTIRTSSIPSSWRSPNIPTAADVDPAAWGRTGQCRTTGARISDGIAVVHETRAHRPLESCGLIHTSKSGRVRTCTLERQRLALVDDWLAGERRIWEARTDRLEQLVTNQEETQ